MMLRTADNEYIQVPDVEVERQAKLFQSIGDTSGDFSYEFEIDNNSDNLDKLGIISPVDGFQKTIYTVNDISLLDDEGSVLYTGYVRIQSIQDTITLSFFSGNNNWFSAMSDNISDLDLSDFEIEVNITNITNSWVNTEGVIFPYVNSGAFSTRSYITFTLNDFIPFVYVKDIIKKCFAYSGLKLSGEIVTDWRYEHLITTSNRITTRQEIQDRTVSVSKVADQTITTIGSPYEVVEFELQDSVGTHSNWDSVNFRYTADVPMIIETTISYENTYSGTFGTGQLLIKNGTEIIDGTSSPNDEYTFSSPRIQGGIITPIFLDAGDYVDFRIDRRNVADTITVNAASFEIRPVRLLKLFPLNILPQSTQLDFCLDVFKLFNTVIDYDPFTKTVTVDFFKNAIRNDELDISEYIDPSTIRVDYNELIGDYGKLNVLKYTEADNDTIKDYNKTSTYPYGSGIINSENEFVDKEKDILESTFVATPEDNRNPYGISMAKLDFTEIERGQEYTASITNVSGEARFTVSEVFSPVVGEVIEVYDSSDETYLGQWVIDNSVSVTAFEVGGILFSTAVTVRLRRIEIVPKQNSDQVLLLVAPESFAGTAAYAWFYKPQITNTGYTNLNDYTKSLSFGENITTLPYQRTMIEDYWADLGPILQDPIKIYVDAYLPKSVFESITFKQPIRLKTDRFNARFIPNRITGYKNSSSPCTLELIKLGN